jgi:NADH-quinone oxidoreductase subunit J
MIIQAICFYLFSAIAVASGVMVIAGRNPVHSVLFLIVTFFSAGGLFVLLGAEFLAMTLVFVYVGAVAVLFLFVVMMLDIDFVELREGFQRYLPIGALIGGILFAELVLVFGYWLLVPAITATSVAPMLPDMSNTQALGALLYTKYVYVFQAAGIVLLIAMIGAIVLTLRAREGVRRQSAASQIYRPRAESVEVVKIEIGKGV